MKTISFAPLFAIFYLSLFMGCSSFNTEPILRRQNVTILQLSDKDYPDADSDLRPEVPSPRDFPELTKEDLAAVFGRFRFEKKGLWKDTRDSVYLPAELPDLTALLLEAIRHCKAGHRLVVITRHDPDRSVLSRMHRNTLLFWADENGLNFVFGEIHEALPSEHFLSDEDWANILPISLRQPYRDLKLLPADFFRYKSILGLRHDTWAIVPLDQIAKLRAEIKKNKESEAEQSKPSQEKTEKKQTESNSEESPAKNASEVKKTAKGEEKTEASLNNYSQKKPGKNAIERLRALKKAHEEGLITDEEYQKRREEILKEF